jgi:hypothetical protein
MAFNEKSKYCIIPNKMRKIQRMIDTNDDGHISFEEEKRAIEVLEKVKLQRLKEVQGTFMSYMNSYQEHQ